MSQALPVPKQLNLNKLSDAGGSQIQWLSDAARTDFSITSGISHVVSAGTDVAAFSCPVCMEELAARFIDSLVGMRTKEVSLRL